jgi:glycosyltransferase involved in cell wall biosynthesis
MLQRFNASTLQRFNAPPLPRFHGTIPCMTPRLLMISHDTIGSRMAGPGIRAWELAHQLAAHQPVTLIAPQPIDLPGGQLILGSYAWGTPGALAPFLAQADVVLANGFVLRAHPELVQTQLPLALDVYDPVLLEDLETARNAPAHERMARQALMQELLQRQLLAADFLICATERQRDLYLGALMASRRITPALIDADSRLRQLIDVVGFGLPQILAEQTAPGMRGVIAGIEPDHQVLLWTGGMWDWLDPLSLIEAMPLVLTQFPNAHVVFLAGQHPGMVDTMRIPQLAEQRAEALGLLDRHIHFYRQWIPYAERANFLLEADLAVSLHHDTLETAYAAVRSRFLDHLWAGRASIVTAGDAAAELVARHQLGRVVPAGDVAALARAIIGLLADANERQACAARAQALAQRYTWRRVAEPLTRFCSAPWRTRADVALPEMLRTQRVLPKQTEVDMEQYLRFREEVGRLHSLWKLEAIEPGSALPLVGQAKRLANTLIRWYMQPIIAQQNAFNAATVNAVQALADTTERLVAQQAPLQQHVADIEQHLLDIDDAQTEMARRMVGS